MSMYYLEDKKPEDAPSWAKPVSEAYETPKYISQKPSQKKEPRPKPSRLETSFMRGMSL